MLAFDGIFAFSIVPLRAAAILGAIAIALSCLFSIYSVIVKFFLHSPQGFTATILVMTFLSGMNLFFLGVIGEYVGRVYEETKARPHYIVGKIIGRSGRADRPKRVLGGVADDWETSKPFPGESVT
jgi:dolichol-phosphate mannosyltransferase